MSKNAFIILFSVIIALLVISFIKSDNSENLSKPANEALINYDIDKVDSVEINSAEFNLILIKKDNSWFVATRDNYPANSSSVNRLLISLSELRSSQLITTNKDNHNRLGLLKDDALTITLFSQETELAGLYIGRKREVKGQEMAETFVRSSSSNSVFLIAEEPPVEQNPGYWLKEDLLSLPPEIIQEIRFLEGEKPFRIVKKMDKEEEKFYISPISDEDQQKDWAVKNVASMFSNITLNDVFNIGTFTPGNDGMVKLVEAETKAKRIYTFSATEKEGEFFIHISIDNKNVSEPEKDKDGKLLVLPDTDFTKWVFKVDTWLAANFKKSYNDLVEKKKQTAEEVSDETTENTTEAITEDTEESEQEIITEEVKSINEKPQEPIKTDGFEDPESAPVEPEL